jgi:hypothetical protein
MRVILVREGMRRVMRRRERRQRWILNGRHEGGGNGQVLTDRLFRCAFPVDNEQSSVPMRWRDASRLPIIRSKGEKGKRGAEVKRKKGSILLCVPIIPKPVERVACDPLSPNSERALTHLLTPFSGVAAAIVTERVDRILPPVVRQHPRRRAASVANRKDDCWGGFFFVLCCPLPGPDADTEARPARAQSIAP